MKNRKGLARRFGLAGGIVLALGGCVTDGVLEQAQRLANQGRWEESLKLLEQARGAEGSAPREGSPVPLQAALIGTRSLAVQNLLARADASRERDDFAAAQTDYERVLRIEPGNARAQGGLQALRDRQRRAKALEAAAAQIRRGAVDDAERTLRPLLLDAPGDARALALTERIDESRLKRPGAGIPELDLQDRAPISMEFRDADLRKVFDAFSRTSGINFVFDRDIKPDAKVTVLVRNASIKEAIDSLLLSNQLEKRVLNASTLFIYPSTPQKQKEHQELVIRNFHLSSADAKQAMSLLKTIVKAKDVFIDEKRNTLVMRDTPEAVALAEKLIAAHDQPEAEVMLVVEVMEIKRTRLGELGLSFPTQIKFSVPSPSNLGTVRGLPSSVVNVSGLDPLLAINLRKVLSEANLLANPRIRVRNREKAKIHVGDRVPYSTTTSSATTSLVTQNITYLDVGLKLEVEPQVFLDDDVAIKVALEVSSVVKDVQVGTGQTVPQVGTRTASTTLTLKSGETQILAGLIRDDEKLGSSRLPGLGDIPVLGRLFSNESTEAEKTEILLSITPYVLRNIERPGPSLTEYPSGSEGGTRSGASSASAPARVGAGGTPILANPAAAVSAGGAISVTGAATSGTGAAASGAASGGSAAAASVATPEFETPPGITTPAGGPPGISTPGGG